MNEELYKHHILDHYKNPRNKAEMEEPDTTQVAKNASCGDSYILYLQIREGTIGACTFSGVGCAISQAAASMLTEKIIGMSIERAKHITEQDIYTMLGVPISVGREKCALLVYHAFMEAIRTYA